MWIKREHLPKSCLVLYDYTSMIQETEWTIVHVNAEHGGSKQGLATMRTKAICITYCKPTLHRESMLRNFWQQKQDIGWGLDIWCTWCTQRVPKFGNEKDLLQDAASKQWMPHQITIVKLCRHASKAQTTQLSEKMNLNATCMLTMMTFAITSKTNSWRQVRAPMMNTRKPLAQHWALLQNHHTTLSAPRFGQDATSVRSWCVHTWECSCQSKLCKHQSKLQHVDSSISSQLQFRTVDTNVLCHNVLLHGDLQGRTYLWNPKCCHGTDRCLATPDEKANRHGHAWAARTRGTSA